MAFKALRSAPVLRATAHPRIKVNGIATEMLLHTKPSPKSTTSTSKGALLTSKISILVGLPLALSASALCSSFASTRTVRNKDSIPTFQATARLREAGPAMSSQGLSTPEEALVFHHPVYRQPDEPDEPDERPNPPAHTPGKLRLYGIAPRDSREAVNRLRKDIEDVLFAYRKEELRKNGSSGLRALPLIHEQARECFIVLLPEDDEELLEKLRSKPSVEDVSSMSGVLYMFDAA